MRRKLFTFFLALVAGVGTMFASDTSVDGIWYNFNDDDLTAEVTYQGDDYDSNYDRYSGEVVIPSSVIYNSVTYSVTSIGEYAFELCESLTSVTIPNSVTSIGEYAFESCASLTSVTIPNSVTSIGWSAFSICRSLTSVTIGNSVTSIGSYVFQNCSGLTSLTIGNSVTSIGYRAFDGCSNITSVVWNAKNCNGWNFGSQVTSFIFGNEVEVIPDNICSGMKKLTSIEIPNSVTSIGDLAFDGCSSLTSVTIPNSVTSIGSSAFSGCSGLTSVTIPNSVTSIGSSAFNDCSSLTSIEIPNSVTGIGEYAFELCESLTSVTIPNSVTSIGSSAFTGCSSLTSVTCEAVNPPALEGNVFNGVDKFIPLYVPAEGIAAYQTATGWNEFTNIQAIPSSGGDTPLLTEKVQIGDLYYNLNATDQTAEVTSQNGEYTYWSTTITTADIPASVTYNDAVYSVTSIGSSAFRECTGLTSVTIPNSVTSIESQAFSNCSSLTSVTIPSSVTSIGGWVFENCSSLTTISVAAGNSVYDSRDNCNAIIVTATNILFAGCKNTVIPSSVTGLGDTSFGNCDGLTSITIPSSVTSIGGNAFSNCISLTSITIPSSVTSIGGSAISGCFNLTSITVETANSVYDSRDNCNAIIETATHKLIDGCQNTVIPSSVTSIGSAFQNCISLTSVTIPSSVTNIGMHAFYGCSGLTSITCMAESAPSLEDYVFQNVNKSIPLYVPSGSIAAYQAADEWKEFTNIRAIGGSSTGDTPTFPGDPGTLTYSLELHAAVVDGDTIAGQAPTGAGGYPAGTEATITARDIPGYEFVQWSDSVTDMTRTIVVNESMTLTALYNHSMIEIPVAANQWNFICLPPLGDRQYTEDLFTYDGLTDVKWGIYSGNRRAEGRSGWETPESFNALQGYILYSTTAGTLKINAYVDDIRQGDSNTISAPLSAYASSHTENANWNFLGNPYSQGFNISALADAGIESPITVWNGTGYTTYTPGIDDYTLRPFEAFFIQKPEGTGAPEAITFIR